MILLVLFCTFYSILCCLVDNEEGEFRKNKSFVDVFECRCRESVCLESTKNIEYRFSRLTLRSLLNLKAGGDLAQVRQLGWYTDGSKADMHD